MQIVYKQNYKLKLPNDILRIPLPLQKNRASFVECKIFEGIIKIEAEDGSSKKN